MVIETLDMTEPTPHRHSVLTAPARPRIRTRLMPRNAQTDRDSSVVAGCNQPDYAALEIPTKPLTEYSYAERRAELLQRVLDLGHPSLVHQGKAAECYDVSQQQISKDLDRLGEYIESNLGARRDLITETVFHRSIRGLLEEGTIERPRKLSETGKNTSTTENSWTNSRNGSPTWNGGKTVSDDCRATLEGGGSVVRL